MAVQISEIWSDLDCKFVQDGLGNLKKVTNVASVIVSIDNILKTYRGERVMLSQFASNLRSMVFEGMTESLMKFISREVKDTIETWDPRVKIMEVELISDSDNSAIFINLSFAIRGWPDIFKHEVVI